MYLIQNGILCVATWMLSPPWTILPVSWNSSVLCNSRADTEAAACAPYVPFKQTTMPC